MTYLRLMCFLALSSLGFNLYAQPIQFEYDLKITADPAKCAAYLKVSREAPSAYEQVFSLVKGSMQVATIVNKVDLRKDRYHINPTSIDVRSEFIRQLAIIRIWIFLELNTNVMAQQDCAIVFGAIDRKLKFAWQISKLRMQG